MDGYSRAYVAGIQQLRSERDMMLVAEIQKLCQERDVLLAAMKAVEWVQYNERYGMMWCPSCHALVANSAWPRERWKHMDSCKTQAAIAAVEGE